MNPLGVPDTTEPIDYFADIPDVSVDTYSGRVIPRQLQSGVERGTRTIVNTDGSYVTLGQIPDGGTDFGMAFFDVNGNLVSKRTALTEFLYDPTTGKNIIQIGQLPDGTYGMVVAKPGNDVSAAFS